MSLAKSTRVLTEARVRQIIAAILRKETRKAFSSNLTDLLNVNTPIVIDNPGGPSAAIGFDLNVLSSSTPVAADELIIYDIDLATERKITVSTLNALIDHGSLAGLGDDDHTQYHNDARGDVRYYQKTEFISTSAGAGDSGKPIVLDAAGHVDATMLNDADIDHGNIGGLGDDDHSQYMLAEPSSTDNAIVTWDLTTGRAVQVSDIFVGIGTNTLSGLQNAILTIESRTDGTVAGVALDLKAADAGISTVNSDGGDVGISGGSATGSGTDGRILLNSLVRMALGLGANLNFNGNNILELGSIIGDNTDLSIAGKSFASAAGKELHLAGGDGGFGNAGGKVTIDAGGPGVSAGPGSDIRLTASSGSGLGNRLAGVLIFTAGDGRGTQDGGNISLVCGTTNGAGDAGRVDIISVNALLIPVGTTAQRDGTPINGMIRYNTTLNAAELYENGAWVTFGAAA